MDLPLVVAAAQMCSRGDKAANLAAAEMLVRQAADQGAKFVLLPELFNCLGGFPLILSQAEGINGPTSEWMRRLATELQIGLCGGICERGNEKHGFNTTLCFDAAGELVANYRKIHLFDIDLSDSVRISESMAMRPGETVVTCDLFGAKVGFATCYDLRFPELFRALIDRGVEVICLPSAFTKVTGSAHWLTLTRARAIENQCYFLAANQVGKHNDKLESYGHSLVIDPWGVVLDELDDQANGIAVAPIDRQKLVKVREALPCLRHRKKI